MTYVMRATCSSPLRQRGFSLIEFMVAMVIGIVILTAVAEVMINTANTRNNLERTGRQIENGRFALQILQDDLMLAGYWGEAGVQATPAALPDMCPADVVGLQNAMGVAVQGSGTNCIPAGAKGSSLAIRRASSCANGSVDCLAVDSTRFYVQVPACVGASLGQVMVKQGTTNLTGQTRSCDTLAPIYRYISRVYYITANNELARMEMGPGGTYVTSGPLVDGIQDLQFTYGLDTDGDAAVDTYSIAPAGLEWADVIAVRISLVAHQVDLQGVISEPRNYTLNVPLRNVAGPREVQ